MGGRYKINIIFTSFTHAVVFMKVIILHLAYNYFYSSACLIGNHLFLLLVSQEYVLVAMNDVLYLRNSKIVAL